MEPQNVTKLEKSESIGKLAKALSVFQGQIKVVEKTASNPFFKSKFASLEDIIKAIREPLSKNELSISQFPIGDGGLTTLLMHSSGEYLQATYALKPKDNTPQGVGSALSYMRRYAVGAILSIATGESEDDGNATSQSPKVQKVMHTQHQDHNREDVVVYGSDTDGMEDEEPEAPVVVKKAPSPSVLKKSIVDSLQKLGMPCGTPQETFASIKKTTGTEYTPENLKQIADTLRELVAFEAQK